MFATPRTELQLSVAQGSALANQLDAAQVGQQVVVSVDKQHFSLVVGLLLGLPLVSGFAAVSGALFVGMATSGQALALLVGTLAGAVVARRLTGRLQTTVQKSLAIRAADL